MNEDAKRTILNAMTMDDLRAEIEARQGPKQPDLSWATARDMNAELATRGIPYVFVAMTEQGPDTNITSGGSLDDPSTLRALSFALSKYGFVLVKCPPNEWFEPDEDDGDET